MKRPPLASNATVCIARGRAATGKTSFLLEKVTHLMEDGVDPSRIVVLSATPDSCRALGKRLRFAGSANATLPRIATAREIELCMLDLPAARAATRRNARVLLDFEQRILFEDLKTTRVPPKRLSEMLRFFYRSWADLEPMEDDWFYNDEEKRVYRCLEEQLSYREAYLPDEIARQACAVLTTCPEVTQTACFDHVLVDDYPMLSRASQRMTSLIARESLTVAGDATTPAHALESFPCTCGLDELATAHPACVVVQLEHSRQTRAVARALNTLASDRTMGALSPLACPCEREGRFEARGFTRPADEIKAAADRVVALASEGHAPDSIAVVCTTDTWLREITQALRRRGLPVASPNHLRLSGDTRDEAQCAPARVSTLLKLAANPNDITAVRAWCGFGDHLANSGLFAKLAKAGVRLTLESTSLEGFRADTPLLRQEEARVMRALAEARMLTEQLKGFTGQALLDAACQAVNAKADDLPQAMRTAAKSADDSADAQALVHAVEQAFLYPRCAESGVRVGTLDDFAGLRFSAVVITGLVNGLLPHRSYFDPARVERDRRPSLLARAQARVYTIAGAADDVLVMSWFEEALLSEAEALQLKIDRVRLQNGQRVCSISPSEAIRTLTGVYFHD